MSLFTCEGDRRSTTLDERLRRRRRRRRKMLLTKTRESKAPSTAKVSLFSLPRPSMDHLHLFSLSSVEQCFSFRLWIESNNEQWSRSTRHGSVIRGHRTQHHIQTLGQSSGLFHSLSLSSSLSRRLRFEEIVRSNRSEWIISSRE